MWSSGHDFVIVLAVNGAMNEIGAATQDEVILAWLQAEIESPRFQHLIVGNPPDPEALVFVRTLAHQPDLTNLQQNAIRCQIISELRGFGRGVLLFTGLESDLTWRRVSVTPDEVGEFLYANHPTWSMLAPSRRIAEGAANVGTVQTDENVNAHITALAERIRDDNTLVLSELIALRRPDGQIVIMEGHTRATAYVLEADNLPGCVEMFLGEGQSVGSWLYR